MHIVNKLLFPIWKDISNYSRCNNKTRYRIHNRNTLVGKNNGNCNWTWIDWARNRKANKQKEKQRMQEQIKEPTQEQIKKFWEKLGRTLPSGEQLLLVPITRKEFLKLPIETRRRILSEQINLSFANMSDEEKSKELHNLMD